MIDYIYHFFVTMPTGRPKQELQLRAQLGKALAQKRISKEDSHGNLQALTYILDDTGESSLKVIDEGLYADEFKGFDVEPKNVKQKSDGLLFDTTQDAPTPDLINKLMQPLDEKRQFPTKNLPSLDSGVDKFRTIMNQSSSGNNTMKLTLIDEDEDPNKLHSQWDEFLWPED